MSRSIDDYVEDSHQRFPSAKFSAVGSQISGDVTDAWMQPKRIYGTNEVATFDDGNPMEQLILNIRQDDGESVTLYTKFPAQLAIFEAVRLSGGRLSQGGHLTVTREEDGVPPKKGYNAPQQFSAVFEPPASTGADLDDV